MEESNKTAQPQKEDERAKEEERAEEPENPEKEVDSDKTRQPLEAQDNEKMDEAEDQRGEQQGSASAPVHRRRDGRGD